MVFYPGPIIQTPIRLQSTSGVNIFVHEWEMNAGKWAIVKEQVGETGGKRKKGVTEGGAHLSSAGQLKIYQFHRFY